MLTLSCKPRQGARTFLLLGAAPSVQLRHRHGCLWCVSSDTAATRASCATEDGTCQTVSIVCPPLKHGSRLSVVVRKQVSQRAVRSLVCVVTQCADPLSLCSATGSQHHRDRGQLLREFTDVREPPDVGADLCMGSLIKNPGALRAGSGDV